MLKGCLAVISVVAVIVLGSGHGSPAGTTCRYFVAKSQPQQKPVHRFCFANSDDRLRSISVYLAKA